MLLDAHQGHGARLRHWRLCARSQSAATVEPAIQGGGRVMSSFTERLYQSWLRANGSGTPSRAAAGARVRGYGAQPHVHVDPRNVPGDVLTASPARPPVIGAGAAHSPALSRPVPKQGDRARGPQIAHPCPCSSLEKPVFAEGFNNLLPDYKKEPDIFLSDNEDYSSGSGRL